MEVVLLAAQWVTASKWRSYHNMVFHFEEHIIVAHPLRWVLGPQESLSERKVLTRRYEKSHYSVNRGATMDWRAPIILAVYKH